MNCVWVFFLCLFAVISGRSETPLSIPEYRNQYEINSETIYFSDSEFVQADLRLLVGRKIDAFSNRDLRLAVGGYGLYQDSSVFDYSIRHGSMLQAKLNLWRNWLFFVYEYHYFILRNESKYKDENRFGLYGGYYYPFTERTILDIYAETFHIPEISRNHLLTTGRSSLYWDTKFFDFHIFDLLAEVYVKDAPASWGGSRTDFRIGLKFQPWDYFSAKLFVPMASSEDKAAGEWQGQINIYKVGDF